MEKDRSLDIPLASASKISDAQLKKLNNARALMEKNFQTISSSDLCLPSYYTSIGSKMVDFVEGVFATPEYFGSSSYEEAAEKLIEVTQEVCKKLTELMLDWRNIRLYKASKLKGECTAKDFTDGGMFKKILEDPKNFTDTKLPAVKERMAVLDSLITEKIKELTILPVSGLWSISRELLKTSIENELKKAAYIMFADIMLNYVEEMLENQDVVSRLKYTIF
ncbi:MAG: hypothetical protein QME59_02455 [Candidatus Hydrothermarchaeota archaeon]|nr:hypothetical protein [Candidatus Hydrothermarchaeota archaeon]